jgi:hypothetical protein
MVATDAILEGEKRDEYVNLIHKLSLNPSVNTKCARRTIAAKIIEDNRYAL